MKETCKNCAADEHAAHRAHQIADDGEANHHDRRCQHARHDEKTDGVNRVGFERFDFFGDHHRPHLRGDAGAGKTGKHDRADQRPKSRGTSPRR